MKTVYGPEFYGKYRYLGYVVIDRPDEFHDIVLIAKGPLDTLLARGLRIARNPRKWLQERQANRHMDALNETEYQPFWDFDVNTGLFRYSKMK